MVNVVFKEASTSFTSNAQTLSALNSEISEKYNIPPSNFFLLSNGKIVQDELTESTNDIQLVLKTLGGKGGFGSMLRAIGAQIEKTTNREACRDLSGRRLRDINEEKRLKNWLEKKKREEQENNKDEKFQRKIEKLLAKPKKEFKDEEYDTARSNLLENISDSVEQGFKKSRGETDQQTILSSVGLKRKVPDANGQKKNAKKIKGTLWIDEGISSGSDDSDDDSGSEFEKGESSGSSSSGEPSKS
jgi:hypothetical protein